MKVLLIGSEGRMGQKMSALLTQENIDFLGIDANNRSAADDYNCDVIIDFSSKDCLNDNLALALCKSAPIVIATTGHDEANMALIARAKERIPIFLAANFSVLFNLLIKMLGVVRGDYDICVQEVHHKGKKDIPSGSCKQILAALKRECNSVCSLRVSNVVGAHTVSIYCEDEVLTLSHEAFDRAAFCRGALRACRFILGKPCGLYEMADLI